MGSGKTRAVLAAIEKLRLPTLIIAPLRVATTTWPDEAEKWGFDFKVIPIVGTQKERERALRAPGMVKSINYDNLKWLMAQGGWNFDMVVCDESPRLKGFRLKGGSRRARELAKVAYKRHINLTGTPASNGIVDLWGQQWFVDKGAALGRTFTAFSDRWFRPHPSGFGIVPHIHAQREVEERLKPTTLTVDVKDYFDIKEPIENRIMVDLPPNVREMYKRMERDLFMEINGNPILAANGAVKTSKLLQLASGSVYTPQADTVHNKKIEALESIIEEAAGAPVLVAYQFKADEARLLEHFPEAKIITPDNIAAWNRGEIPVLIAHPASAGHGLNLQHGGNILVFFTVDWSLENHDQIIERIGPTRQMQSGYDRPVFIHYILAKNTLDTAVLERLKSKREVQDILLEAAKKQ
jgi:SNF2 family DNA or RNA helicase